MGCLFYLPICQITITGVISGSPYLLQDMLTYLFCHFMSSNFHIGYFAEMLGTSTHVLFMPINAHLKGILSKVRRIKNLLWEEMNIC